MAQKQDVTQCYTPPPKPSSRSSLTDKTPDQADDVEVGLETKVELAVQGARVEKGEWEARTELKANRVEPMGLETTMLG